MTALSTSQLQSQPALIWSYLTLNATLAGANHNHLSFQQFTAQICGDVQQPVESLMKKALAPRFITQHQLKLL